MADGHDNHSVEQAQQLRLLRMLWGMTSQISIVLVAVGLFLLDLLPGIPLLVYLSTLSMSALFFLAILKSGLNLRLRDPSMTAAQIIVPVIPSIFVMYFVAEPYARTAFLLTATSGLVFGMFALNRTGMMLLSAVMVACYLLLLVMLGLYAPQRINWEIEGLIVLAYSSVLVTIAYLTSYIGALRHKLRQRNEQLQDLVCRDPLTELPNRRSLMEHLQQEMTRCNRQNLHKYSLCISMLDIDYFKQVNDNFGHDVGDAVLCKIGETLQNNLRSVDFVGRFGGEEFVVIMPETNLDGARIMAQRLQDAVAGLRLDELPSGHTLTVSQGLTSYVIGEKLQTTLKRADEALYEAKAAGRNQIVVRELMEPV